MSEREALIDVACHWYDAGRLTKGSAARMAGLTRLGFEDELVRRALPVIRYTREMLDEDLRTLELLKAQGHHQERRAGGTTPASDAPEKD